MSRRLGVIENRTKEGGVDETQEINVYAELVFEVQALGLLVSVSCMHYCTSTSDLSNS